MNVLPGRRSLSRGAVCDMSVEVSHDASSVHGVRNLCMFACMSPDSIDVKCLRAIRMFVFHISIALSWN